LQHKEQTTVYKSQGKLHRVHNSFFFGYEQNHTQSQNGMGWKGPLEII